LEPFQRPQARCSGVASDPHVAASGHPDEVGLLQALHLLAGYHAEQNAAKLSKVKTGRSCINFKKLEDLKLDVAMALVKQAVKSGGLNAEK
jgi:hypothetical protein